MHTFEPAKATEDHDRTSSLDECIGPEVAVILAALQPSTAEMMPDAELAKVA